MAGLLQLLLVVLEETQELLLVLQSLRLALVVLVEFLERQDKLLLSRVVAAEVAEVVQVQELEVLAATAAMVLLDTSR